MRGSHEPFNDSASPLFGAGAPIDAADCALLVAECDHRIANHLALLGGYVRLKSADIDRQAAAPDRKAVHVLLDGVGAQIAAVAKLHRALVADAAAGQADLGKHLHDVCAPFASGLGGETQIIEDLAPDCIVGFGEVIPLSQIAAEVITNALKHACERQEPGTVLVRCRKGLAGEVELEVIDNGGGLPANFDPMTDSGVGFHLIRLLSQKLGAQIAFESTTVGVRFRLTLAPADLAHPGPE